jgi:hypothetical protein
LGLSGKVVSSDIDTVNHTIKIVGSSLDFRLLCNRTIRWVVPSSTLPFALFPRLDGNSMNSTTTYILANVTGEIGDQTAQMTTNGVTPLRFTTLGAGWHYIFPYRDIDNVSINASNQLVIDGNIVSFQDDWMNQPVSVTAGTASVVTHSGHGLAGGTALRFGGITAPGSALLGDVFYVLPVDANSYKLSAVAGGLPLTFTSAGTSVNVQAIGSSTISPVTVSVGTASTINFGSSAATAINHWLGNDLPFTLSGTTLPGAAYSYTDLVVGSALAASFSVRQKIAAPLVAFETAGSGVALTAMNCYGNMLIEKATVLVGGDGDTNSTMTVKNSDGTPLSITGLSNATTTLQPVDPPVIASGSIQVRPIGGI